MPIRFNQITAHFSLGFVKTARVVGGGEKGGGDYESDGDKGNLLGRQRCTFSKEKP